MSQITKFIIIDDDISNNYLCKYIIKNVAKEIEILDFTSANDGLNFIRNKLGNQEEHENAVLFLDLKMPIMDGWKFLEEFDLLPSSIKEKIVIYILTSSIDTADKNKADANQYVKNYVVKPLTKGAVHNILAGLL